MPLKLRLRILLFIFLFIAGIVLLILPADFFDSGQSVCISVLLLDKQCYACGMTRAVMHLIHFDFKGAYEYNWLVFIVFPLLMYLIGDELWKLIKDVKAFKAGNDLTGQSEIKGDS